MKKYLSMFLAMTLILTACLTFGSLAAAQVTPTVTIKSVTSPTDFPEHYTVIENIQAGQQLHPDNSRAINDLATVGLEGSTLITTNFQDGVTSGWKSPSDLITLTINNSAEIYIANYQGNGNPSDSYMDWLSDYEQLKDESGTAITITVANSNPKKLYFFKKVVTLNEGTTQDLTFKTVGGYGNGNYVIFIKWIANPTPDVNDSFTDAEGRNVKIITNPNYWSLSDKVIGGEETIYNDLTESTKLQKIEGADLTGAISVKTMNSDAADATCTSKSKFVWASLELNHSADVYIASYYGVQDMYMGWFKNEGYERVEGATVYTTRGSGNKFQLWKKTYQISEGETQVVNLGNLGPYGDGDHMYFAAIKWIDNIKPVDSITDEQGRNIKFTYNPENWDLSENVIDGEELLFSDKMTSLKYASATGVDLEGAISIRTKYAHGTDPINENKNTKIDVATFEINNSAEIYVMSRYAGQADYMWWLNKYGYKLIDGAKVNTTRSTNYSHVVSKKTIYVKDGETATFSFGNLGPYASGYMYFAAVKFIENPVGVEIKETLSQNASAYKVKYGMAIDDWAFSGGERIITDFGGTGLEGATLIQTNYSDKEDPANNIQYPESGTEYISNDWLTITIDKTANVYVLPTSVTSPGSKYMMWLNKWKLMTDENGEAKYITTNTGSGEEKFYVYYKTFIVPEGETVDVVLNNIGFYGNRMYFAAALPTEGFVINVTAEGKGKVSETGAIGVEKNGTLELTATPDAGYFIKSVTVDGEVLFENINEEKTFSITADKEKNVSVVFEALALPETLATFDKTYTANDGRISGIVFATAPAVFGENTRVEYGVLFSKNKPEAWSPKGEGIFKAMGRFKLEASGNFGIRFTGSGIKAGETYYAMPYAIYRGAEGETVVYGTELNFTPAE